MSNSIKHISKEEWPAVKSLWFALQDAEPDARNALLHDSSVDPAIRQHVTRLMAASETVGERFETPAIAGIGDAPGGQEPEAPSLIGRRLGKYDVVRRIGQGGMGAVYEAVRADKEYEQRVAIKTIWRGADSTVLLQRFRSERQILAGLQHPNIAALVDGGATEEGTPWLAMEYVDGMPIDEYCDKHSLALSARLDLFRQVCKAVQFAHRNFVVHRDLKPSNVLVTADGTVKLLDFGVAKLLDDQHSNGTLTNAGLSPFTASYAAPEQFTGGAISVATDVYSLGALLMVLLAGEPPLKSETLSPSELMDAIRTRPVVAPSEIVTRITRTDAASATVVARTRGCPTAEKLARTLSGELDAITLMALRREPERRYSGAEALADDVLRYLRRDRVHARPDTIGYRIRSFVRRQRPMVLGNAALLVVFLVALGFVWWKQRIDDNNSVIAEQRLREVRTLVSALVYDANDQLADVPGATKARANLVRTAIQALDRASIDAPRDSALLRELAMGYSRAGDVLGNPTQLNLGDIQGADSAYHKAVSIAELLMTHYPNDVSSWRTLALVYERAADVEASVGQLQKALQHQRASLEEFRRIWANDSTRYGNVRGVGIAGLKLGDLQGHPAFNNAGDTAAAVDNYYEAMKWLERAVAMGDTTFVNRRHRAIVSERLGRLMTEQRKFDEANKWLVASMQLRDSLVIDSPLSVLTRRDFAIALYLLCGMHLTSGHPELARTPCEQSLTVREKLLSEDPVSSVLIRGMGIMHGRLGEVYAADGDSALALTNFEKSANYYKKFFAGRSGALNDRRDYAQIELRSATLARATGTADGARRAASAYQTVIASMDSIRKMAPLNGRDSSALRAAEAGLKGRAK